MKYIIIAITILFSTDAYAGEYSFDCEDAKRITPQVKRCENSEVVCYVAVYSGSSITCKFK
jgi:hypothetical protein